MYFLTLLGSTGKKAAHRMLMKLTLELSFPRCVLLKNDGKCNDMAQKSWRVNHIWIGLVQSGTWKYCANQLNSSWHRSLPLSFLCLSYISVSVKRERESISLFENGDFEKVILRCFKRTTILKFIISYLVWLLRTYTIKVFNIGWYLGCNHVFSDFFPFKTWYLKARNFLQFPTLPHFLRFSCLISFSPRLISFSPRLIRFPSCLT
jgi:hypothetical protein